jgi:protein-tyrosine phosphatase
VTDDTMQREFRFTRVFNFRDVGGYPGLDGRTVRWRRLFRSDALSALGAQDREAFSTLGIRTVVDLRRPREVEEYGRVPAWDGLTYRHLHPDHPEWDETPFEEGMDPARYLADRYHDLTEHGAPRLAEAVSIVADESAAPVVVHCVAGKDRTGVVCALVLSLLGVPDEHIDADYTRSTVNNEAWVTHERGNGYPELVMRPHWRSHPGTMLMFLSELRERHGSVERYLTGAGLERDQVTALRTHLLASS